MIGWCALGPVAGNNKGKICNRIVVMKAGTRTTANQHFDVKNDVKETYIKKMLLNMYHNDFTEPTLEKGNTTEIDALTVEDKRFLSLVEEGKMLVDGHYHVPLPLRNPYAELLNNRTSAMNWLNYLKLPYHWLNVFEDYRAFIEDMINKGYLKQSKKLAPVVQSWYIPHHDVYHPSKPGKIRVVFDCSTEFKGKPVTMS